MRYVTADVYLRDVLSKYQVDVQAAENAANVLHPLVKTWAGNYLLQAKFSGSLSKGTAVSISTDADVFLSLSSSTPGTLKHMYETLANAVRSGGYEARLQNVSIGTTVYGKKIDLVPGKRQSQFGNDHSLYKRKQDSWVKTNIDRHVSYVQQSGRMEEIRLFKIWRALHGIDFPSFYLELAVIDALRYSRVGNIADNVWRALSFLRDDFIAKSYFDPANTNNRISDDLTPFEKSNVATQAGNSLSMSHWSEIVW